MAERFAYVIGEAALYDRMLARGQVVKPGRDAHFPGSIVWRTLHEAEGMAHTLNHLLGRDVMKVYGVYVDWDYMTTPALGFDFHDLLRDCPVVHLSPCTPPPLPS